MPFPCANPDHTMHESEGEAARCTLFAMAEEGDPGLRMGSILDDETLAKMRAADRVAVNAETVRQMVRAPGAFKQFEARLAAYGLPKEKIERLFRESYAAVDMIAWMRGDAVDTAIGGLKYRAGK